MSETDETLGALGSGPTLGRPVRGSETGVPLMALFDLLGRRWSITCLWALRAGPLTFRELQAVDDRISPTSLNRRLKEHREAGLVTRAERGYALTPLGQDLLDVGLPLVPWSERWAEQLQDPQSDDAPSA